MNKREFLEILRVQLSGSMQEGRVAAHLRYYEDYIQSRLQMGESEAQVLQALGDPRLIAKTLLESEKSFYAEGDGSDHYRSYEDTYRVEEEPAGLRRRGSLGQDIKSLVRWVLWILLIVLVLAAVGHLFVALLPFAAIMAAAIFILRLLDRNR